MKIIPIQSCTIKFQSPVGISKSFFEVILLKSILMYPTINAKNSRATMVKCSILFYFNTTYDNEKVIVSTFTKIYYWKHWECVNIYYLQKSN